METNRYEGRAVPGPVTVAALLLFTVEKLYALCIELAEATGDGDLADRLKIEWARERDHYKPALERIIKRGR